MSSTLAAGGGGVSNTCTAGTIDTCIGPGDTCDAEVICGRMTCSADGTWGGCNRTIDTVRDENNLDICNGIDDDCDGTVDEDCVPDGGGEPCPPGQTRDPATGVCTCSGFCPFGAQMNPATCQCEATCGDWICADSEQYSCPEDCAPTCGDGFCSWMEDEWSCPDDCGGGSSCICDWDCPPNDPACVGFCGDGVCQLATENSTNCPSDCSLGGGGGGGGDGGGGYDTCSDGAFWEWYIDAFGFEEAVAMFESMCAT